MQSAMQSTAASIAELLDGLSKLAWPIIVGIVLWKLYPVARKIMESRSFTVKIGGNEISVQEASEQVIKQIGDLQDKIVDRSVQETAGELLGSSEATPKILWVDDHPSNNAVLMENLRADGFTIVEVTSTEAALETLQAGSKNFDLIISDMGRLENGRYLATAGLSLIEATRKANIKIPTYIYTTQANAMRYRTLIVEHGGNAVTSSPLELLKLIKLSKRGRPRGDL